MNQAEFTAIRESPDKEIHPDIRWSDDEDHSPAVQFRAEVQSQTGYSMFAMGTYNGLIDKLSYVVVIRGVGCVFRLDLGSDHHNPTCQNVGGDRHCHIWNEMLGDHVAVAADWIIASASDPVAVWQEFCESFNISHNGALEPPAPVQAGVFP
ncbi:MAG: hypothetical protein AABO41_16305 [Acidobacteriota bacterium]